MKKLNLTTCLLIAVVAMQAQNTVPHDQGNQKKKKTDFYVEAFGGLNLGFIQGSSSYNSPRISAQFGVGATIFDFSKVLGLRAELAYSMQGAKYTDDYSGYSYKGTEQLDYLILPIFVRYQNPGGFYADLGVQPGLLISAKDKYDYSGSSGSGSGSDDIKDLLNSFDLGIPIGVGYRFKNRIGIGARVVPGVTNMNKSSSGYSYTDRNMVVSFRASYSF